MFPIPPRWWPLLVCEVTLSHWPTGWVPAEPMGLRLSWDSPGGPQAGAPVSDPLTGVSPTALFASWLLWLSFEKLMAPVMSLGAARAGSCLGSSISSCSSVGFCVKMNSSSALLSSTNWIYLRTYRLSWMEPQISSFIEKRTLAFPLIFGNSLKKKKFLNCQLLKNVQMLETAGKLLL